MADRWNAEDTTLQERALLIHLAVEAVRVPASRAHLDTLLAQASENGWVALVGAIQKILTGERNLANLGALDDEDRKIILAILRGIEDRASLPDIASGLDIGKTAMEIGTLILAVRWGNEEAIKALSSLTTQMTAATGDIAQVGLVLRLLVSGERRLERLSYNMGETGTLIVREILAVLEKREVY